MRFRFGLMANLLTMALAMDAVTHELPDRFECGTPAPTESELKVIHEMNIMESFESTAKRLSNSTNEKIHIDVYIHTISAMNSTLLSDEDMQSQFNVMADVFSMYGIEMSLVNTSKTVDEDWAKNRAGIPMKKALRQGRYRDLNLYFVDFLDRNMGVCTLPQFGKLNLKQFWIDGCTLLASSVPGGSHPTYNQGMTTVHEVGHWLGLLHTFDNSTGCKGFGDLIDDTPMQCNATRGCPIGKDSCPADPGLDPIHNYMDYSDDWCYQEFTPGQVRRIFSVWNRTRG